MVYTCTTIATFCLHAVLTLVSCASTTSATITTSSTRGQRGCLGTADTFLARNNPAGTRVISFGTSRFAHNFWSSGTTACERVYPRGGLVHM